MDGINGIIEKMLNGKNIREKYLSALLKVHWTEIAGAQIAQKSQPVKLDMGTLFLQVEGAAWAHNLLTLKKDLLLKINAFSCLTSKVTDIKIVNTPKIQSFTREEPDREEEPLPELTNEEEKAIREKVNNLQDPLLAKKLFEIIRKDKKHKKYHWRKKGRKCDMCGTILAYEKKRCRVCEKTVFTRIKEKLTSMFGETPWLDYREALENIECSRNQFFAIKEECVQDFLLRALRKDASNSDVRSYVMIKTGCPVGLLTEKQVEETMAAARRSNRVSSYRFRYDASDR